MDKRSYDRSESIDVMGKPFHYTPDRKEFLDTLVSKYPNQSVFTKEEIDNTGTFPYWVKSSRYNFRDNGVFNLTQIIGGYNGGYSESAVVPPVNPAPQVVAVAPPVAPQNMPVAAATESVNLNDNIKIIPEKMSNYVPFGHFKDVKGIIKSKIFFPVFITGLSGNGKTLMIEQTCAQLKR